ncbi:hypothetical protein BDAP_002222 [Binucleata daphniae]
MNTNFRNDQIYYLLCFCGAICGAMIDMTNTELLQAREPAYTPGNYYYKQGHQTLPNIDALERSVNQAIEAHNKKIINGKDDETASKNIRERRGIFEGKSRYGTPFIDTRQTRIVQKEIINGKDEAEQLKKFIEEDEQVGNTNKNKKSSKGSQGSKGTRGSKKNKRKKGKNQRKPKKDSHKN